MRILYPQKGKLPLKILRLEASIPRDLSLALPQKLPPSFIPKPLSKGSSGHLYPRTRVQTNWRLGEEYLAAPRKDELWAEGSAWGALYLSPFGEKRNCAFVLCPVLPGGLGSFAVIKRRGVRKSLRKEIPSYRLRVHKASYPRRKRNHARDRASDLLVPPRRLKHGLGGSRIAPGN